MSITSIKDAIKAIAQSLQPSTIIPSLLLILINTLVVFPQIWSDNRIWSLSNDNLAAAVIFATITVSYILYAINNPLIRLVEGYIGRDNHLVRDWLEAKELEKRTRYNKLIELKRYYPDSPERQQVLQELDTHFPSNAQSVLATKLGNTIAAFEHYPYTRYGIDAVAMWPRMFPVLQEKGYIEVVAQQKTVFDFLLNLMFVVLTCGLEVTYLLCYLNHLIPALFCFVMTYILTRLLYLGVVNAAVLWGYSVRVAFDLYRGELWKLLHLKPASSYSEEVKRWREISSLLKYGEECGFDGFLYTQQEKPETRETPISIMLDMST